MLEPVLVPAVVVVKYVLRFVAGAEDVEADLQTGHP